MVEQQRLAETERRIQILEDLLGVGEAARGTSPRVSLAGSVSRAEAAASESDGYPAGESPSSPPDNAAALLCGQYLLGPMLGGRSPGASASPRRGPQPAVGSRRCGGPPTVRRDASQSGASTPTASPSQRWQGRAAAPGSPSSPADSAAITLGITDALRQVDGKLAQPLQQRLQSLVQELEAAREQVREQGKQSAQLQRALEDQRQAIAKANELEEQNKLFSTRHADDEHLYESLPELLAEERTEWERCRLAAEDLAVEHQFLREFQLAVEKDKEKRQDLAEQARELEVELEGHNKVIAELQTMGAEAAKQTAENRKMLQRIDKLRNGRPSWK